MRQVGRRQREIGVGQEIDRAGRIDQRVVVAHIIDGGETGFGGLAGGGGIAPDPPEAAEARACVNAVLPAPVGPTTAIALTMLAVIAFRHGPWPPCYGRRPPPGERRRRFSLMPAFTPGWGTMTGRARGGNRGIGD